ncbi:dTDP-4-dehydrorhamnose reductase [Roseibium sediminis]|uniref:dTDP-4-dehydrorhamnose reductase n=1 Tax=Roseibium sediminis TaxID=1775174 RepID=UPI00123DE532|nr:dTDP-4-dehydrorhamnose reductase [Roseibium sediminis]
MKILVTGRDGQLARSLTEIAKGEAFELVAVGRPTLDLVGHDTIQKALEVLQPDLVINAAAYTAVDTAESECATAVAVNCNGAGALAAHCAEHDIPIIHISTDYVFDGSKTMPYIETDPVNPLGIYGHSKLEGERQVAAANPRHIILRTAWVYSAFGSNFVKTMLRLAVTREEISVVADQVGNPTYAPHLATAILNLATHLNIHNDEDRWGIYHCAGTGDTTWYAFAREIFERSTEQGLKVPRVCAITSADYPTLARRPENSRLDCHKLEAVFGIRLPEWKQGVRECLARLLTAT